MGASADVIAGSPAESFRPESDEQVAEIVSWAAAEEQPLEVLGLGSKRGLGRSVQASRSLDLSGLTGITLYEPEELVLSARAGTPLAEIEAALEAEGQSLAFEPPDLGPLYGAAPNTGSIGGVIACNLSGSRRIKAGAARDHFLGLTAVSGRGEVFRSGGRVVKNVTGYDLGKLLAGSYGTLAAITEVTLKVLPRPETLRTVLVFGLDDAAALSAMTQALGSTHEVSGAAHLPASLASRTGISFLTEPGKAVTALRLEGPRDSVLHRTEALRRALDGLGETGELHSQNSDTLWRALGSASLLDAANDPGPQSAIWRISVAPQSGPAVMAKIAGDAPALGYYDWGGGLLWIALPVADDAAQESVRAAVAGKGHATLMRAPEAIRAVVPVFEPPDAAKMLLSERIKDGFDPNRVLNPGRMYAGL